VIVYVRWDWDEVRCIHIMETYNTKLYVNTPKRVVQYRYILSITFAHHNHLVVLDRKSFLFVGINKAHPGIHTKLLNMPHVT